MTGFAETLEALKARGFADLNVEEKLAQDVLRIRRTFSNRNNRARLSHRRSNWLQIDPTAAMNAVISFLESL